MAEQRSPALHEVLVQLGDVVDGADTSTDVQHRLRRLEHTVGSSTPSRFTGLPGTELAQATNRLDDAERALARAAEIEAQLPQLQAQAERRRSDAMGKWIALAAVGAILLAILIGQLV